MSSQPIRNKNYYNPDTTYRGDCPRFPNKTATLFIHLGGSKIAKNDLDLDYHVASFECSLLNAAHDECNTCRLDCPIMKKFKNSHSY